jgi:hypothetical protein
VRGKVVTATFDGVRRRLRRRHPPRERAIRHLVRRGSSTPRRTCHASSRRSTPTTARDGHGRRNSSVRCRARRSSARSLKEEIRARVPLAGAFKRFRGRLERLLRAAPSRDDPLSSRARSHAGAGGIATGSDGGVGERAALLALTTRTPRPKTAPRNHRRPPSAGTSARARKISHPEEERQVGGWWAVSRSTGRAATPT